MVATVRAGPSSNCLEHITSVGERMNDREGHATSLKNSAQSLNTTRHNKMPALSIQSPLIIDAS
jgi:hypothetical protein